MKQTLHERATRAVGGRRARLFSLGLVALLGGTLGLAAMSEAQSAVDEAETAVAERPAPKPLVRVVRLSLRVEGDGRDAYLELPLPQSDEHQTISDEKLLTRGFQVEEVMQDGNRLAILTYPKLEGRKRITYEFKATTRKTSVEVPPVPVPVAAGEPAEEDRIWLRATRQLQATSPIIREKLITYATPRLVAGESDAIRIAWDLTHEGYTRKAKGSNTVLKATRIGHASDKGLDRLFATFLRTSGVPSRPVVGVEIGKLKNPKHASHWVEAKAGGSWVPMSVPRGEYGKLPARYVKLAHGDRPFLVRDGVKEISYRWKLSKPEIGAEATR